MTQTIDMDVGDEGSVLVELRDGDGRLYPAGSTDAVGRAEDAFGRLQNTIRICAIGFRKHIDTLLTTDAAPNEVSVEFGIGLDADVNVLISRVSHEANFKVTLTWSDLGPQSGKLE